MALLASLEDVSRESEIQTLLAVECRQQEMKAEDLTALYGWMRQQKNMDSRSEIHVWSIIDRLVGQNKDVDERVVRTGIITLVTDVLVRETNKDYRTAVEDNSPLLRSCFRILGTLGTVAHSDEILKKADTIGVILASCKKIIQQGDGSRTSLLEEAITCLALLAPRARHKQKIVAHNGVPFILQLLKEQTTNFDCAILVACCRFVTKFAEKGQDALRIMQHEGIPTLIALFIMATDKFLPNAQSDPSMADAKEQYREVLVASCTALWTCCIVNEDIQDSIIKSGFIYHLARLMTSEKSICPEPCFGILRRIAKVADVERDILSLDFANDRVLRQGFHLERDINGQICGKVKEVIGFVGNLATTEAGREAILGTQAVWGTVKAIEACCKTGDIDRKTAKIALAALVNLTVSRRICEDAYTNTNICAVLLESMKTFGHNANVLEQAMGVLSHLATEPQCCRQLIKGGAGEAILCYLTEHQQDLFMNKRCILALRRMLATCPEQVHSLLVDGANEGLQRVLTATRRHIYDSTVAQELVLLLEALHLPPQVLDLAEDTCTTLLRHHSFLHANVQRLFGGDLTPPVA